MIAIPLRLANHLILIDLIDENHRKCRMIMPANAITSPRSNVML